MKKGDRGSKLGILMGLLIFGAFLFIGLSELITGWTDIKNEFTGNHASLEDVLLSGRKTDDEISGYYRTEIDASLGRFASETKNGEVDTAYYIIWLADDSIAAASVRKDADMQELDRITEETWAYVNGDTDYFTSDTFNGTVKAEAFSGTFYTMYLQTLDELGITDTDFVIRNVLLDYSEGGSLKHDVIMNIIMVIIGLLGFLFFLGGILLTIFEKKPESGTQLTNEAAELVSFKHAKDRITNPEIKGCYKKMSRMSRLLLGLCALSLIIPGALYAYTVVSNSGVQASERVAQYSFSDSEAVDKAAENETADITIASVPKLIYSEDMDDYYILDYNGLYYVAIIDSEDYGKIKGEIEKNGSYTLYGYLQTPSDRAKDSALEYVNSIYGTDHKSSEYDKYLGKYALNVEENYAGVGIPVERIRNFMIGAAIFIICLAVFGYNSLSRSRYMINSLRRFSDSEYAQLERELSGNCERYPQNLFITENFIVMLYSYSAYKDSSNNENSTFFAKCSDIKWIYPSNHVVGGKPTNYGVTVYGPEVGTSTLIGLPNREDCVATIEQIFASLTAKCPGALFGYTDENRKALGL